MSGQRLACLAILGGCWSEPDRTHKDNCFVSANLLIASNSTPSGWQFQSGINWTSLFVRRCQEQAGKCISCGTNRWTASHWKLASLTRISPVSIFYFTRYFEPIVNGHCLLAEQCWAAFERPEWHSGSRRQLNSKLTSDLANKIIIKLNCQFTATISRVN